MIPLLVDTSKLLQQTLSLSGKDEQAQSNDKNENAHCTTVPIGEAEGMKANAMLKIPQAAEGSNEAQSSDRNENTLSLPVISANAL